MLEIALGSAMMYYFATEAFDIKKKPAEAVYYTEVLDSRNASFTRMHHEPVLINPAVEDQFRGIVRQAYDYSCGSAALTTLINGYVGAQLTEQQTMDGLLRYGEYERIIERRSFSLLDMKRFNQVHHMVSEVEATLKAEVHPFHVLLSALPGGSITGAPKIRAMQIIEELEGAPRGAYCGSMGYFNFDGTGSWNILIRSIQKFQDEVSLWAGGGITIASECEAEYQECFDKVSALLNLLNTFVQTDAE